MQRKLIATLIGLSSTLCAISLDTCAQGAIQGFVSSIKPCDIVNCVDPSYIDPCMIINCNTGERVPTYGGSDSSTTTEE